MRVFTWRPGQQPVETSDYSVFQSIEERQLAYHEVGELRVSTIFLNIDHSFSNQGPPVLFETMVFPKDSWAEIYADRYHTEQEAREGHLKALEWAKSFSATGTNKDLPGFDLE